LLLLQVLLLLLLLLSVAAVAVDCILLLVFSLAPCALSLIMNVDGNELLNVACIHTLPLPLPLLPPHHRPFCPAALAAYAIVFVAGGMPLQVNVLKSNSRSFRVEIALQMQSKWWGGIRPLGGVRKFHPVVAVCANFFCCSTILLAVTAVATHRGKKQSSNISLLNVQHKYLCHYSSRSNQTSHIAHAFLSRV